MLAASHLLFHWSHNSFRGLFPYLWGTSRPHVLYLQVTGHQASPERWSSTATSACRRRTHSGYICEAASLAPPTLNLQVGILRTRDTSWGQLLQACPGDLRLPDIWARLPWTDVHDVQCWLQMLPTEATLCRSCVCPQCPEQL